MATVIDRAPAWNRHPDAVTYQGHRIAFETEADFGPGGMFLTQFLGSRQFPLSADEYWLRCGPRFSASPAFVEMRHPLDARAAVRVEMTPKRVDEPAIAVLLLPGQAVRFPNLDGFRYREFPNARVGA